MPSSNNSSLLQNPAGGSKGGTASGARASKASTSKARRKPPIPVAQKYAVFWQAALNPSKELQLMNEGRDVGKKHPHMDLFRLLIREDVRFAGRTGFEFPGVHHADLLCCRGEADVLRGRSSHVQHGGILHILQKNHVV